MYDEDCWYRLDSHLIRKPIENPTKQLLLGHVAGREIIRRTRSGGRTGRQTQPLKTLQRYIRQTLDEQIFPTFDIRNNLTFTRSGQKLVEKTVALYDIKHQVWWSKQSIVSIKSERHKETETRTGRNVHQENDKNGDVRILEKCPLKCGFVGQNMSKYFTEQPSEILLQCV